MKKVFILIAFFMMHQVFAACPVNGDGSSCIAEFTPFKPTEPSQIQPMQTPSALGNRNFYEIPDEVQNINKTESADSQRIFGPKNSDYSYNANCQFGNCRLGGTPKNVSAEE